MKPAFDDTFLARWMAGELTPEELQEFQASEDYEVYSKIAGKSKQFLTPEFNTDNLWQKIQENKKTGEVRLLNTSSLWLRVAAMAVLILGSYFAFELIVNNAITRYTTEVAQHQEIYLPDQSLVSMNAVSQVTFKPNSWEEYRKVNLTGEAFFKVTKGSTFDVVTPEGTITVVGTQFNVNQRNHLLEVSCYEGTVKVTHDKKVYMLTKGKSVFITPNKTEKLILENAEEPTWLLGESSFTNVTLQNVLDELQRQYLIELTVKSVDLNQHYTGSFTHNNLQTALKSVCEPMQISYTVNDNQVTLQGK